ncbi:hypothetical protein GQ457_12G031930 [Hibiscus cannabinus]
MEPASEKTRMQGAHGASSSRNDLSGGSYKRKGKNKKKFTHGMASSKESCITCTITGTIEEVNETTLRIKELPLRRWTQGCKEFLESVITSNGSFIKEFKQFSDDKTVTLRSSCHDCGERGAGQARGVA